MGSLINPDEQNRQQAFLNMRASQNAVNKMSQSGSGKRQPKQDRKALFTTLAVVAALIVALVLLSYFGIL